ncbi:hypothetical protein [Arsenicibacter rosenii]|uniref:Uncharacterized protein n=1 Tax=Arsenicibacter rosenii TaxID=1750698 RepID=A0A1S2VM07_9BACT|nr:hypothetical protein [Arsenicibacter rosenii]OIN59801.1 hypothetical protein BLX24_08055 [Arsenicibacter rosenii]
MAITYADMLPPTGEEVNMGGLSERLWFARKVDIQTWSAPAASPASPYILTSAFQMKTGKKFYECYITQDTGDLELQSIGEVDGKSFKPVLKAFYPGLEDAAITFFNQIKNDVIIVIAELPDGKMLQLGNERFSMRVSPNFKTGVNSGRGRGMEFEVTGFIPYIYRYAATVPVTPAS